MDIQNNVITPIMAILSIWAILAWQNMGLCKDQTKILISTIRGIENFALVEDKINSDVLAISFVI